MTTIDPDALETWRVAESGRADFHVVGERGQLIVCNVEEPIARIIASAPALIKFLAMCTKPHLPISIPVITMLANCGIELSTSTTVHVAEDRE